MRGIGISTGDMISYVINLKCNILIVVIMKYTECFYTICIDRQRHII